MSSSPSSNPSFGRYEILSELGRGSMGIVYQARDPKIDRIVAIKTLSLGQEDDDEAEFRMRFILEAQAAGRLSHPGIVTVYDVAEDTETHAPYIVMEYVAGQTLKKLLAPGYAKVPLETALRLAQEVAEALAYAHARGVVHRDIKPANIMITEDEHAKIMDFGVAKLDLSQRTQSGVLMGTPAYMSPEQLTGHSVDGRSDIFSLGVVLYTMLVGHRPFQGNGISTIGFKVVNNNPLPLTTINPALPPEIDTIVSRAIAKELDKRYQSGSDLANDLANLRQQLRDCNQDAPDPGLLTVTSFKTNRSTESGAQKTQPYNSSTKATNPPVQAAKQGISKQRLYAIAAIVLVALAGAIAFGRHRLKPVTLSAKSAAPPFTSAPKETTPASTSNPTQTPRPQATDDDDNLSSGSLKKSAVVPQPDANLRIDVEHPFSSGKVSLWVDGKLKYTEALHGEAKKKLIVFRKTEGHTYDKIQVPPGKHSIRVRVQSTEQYYDLTNTITANLPENATQTLSVRCQKEEVKLAVE
jgi:serine/threonine protein kinase